MNDIRTIRKVKPRLPREKEVDVAITQFLRFALPKDAVHFHCPNGGYRLGVAELGRLKAAGYVGGIPDRCILWNGRCLWFEVKRPGKPTFTDGQMAMFPRFAAAGFPVAVVQSVDDVIALLTEAGVPIRVQERMAV